MHHSAFYSGHSRKDATARLDFNFLVFFVFVDARIVN